MKYVLLKNKETGERSIHVSGEGRVRESEDPARYNMLRKRAKANNARLERNEAYRDMGLVKTPHGWE